MVNIQISDDVFARLNTLAQSKNITITELLEETVEAFEKVNQHPEHTDVSNQLELAVTAAHLGIWTMDIRTGVVTWNDELFEIYGITREEFNQSVNHWERAVHPEDFDYADSRLKESLQGKPVYDVLFRIMRPDGEIRYISGCGDPHF